MRILYKLPECGSHRILGVSGRLVILVCLSRVLCSFFGLVSIMAILISVPCLLLASLSTLCFSVFALYEIEEYQYILVEMKQF